MNLRALLAIPVALSVAGWWSPPKTDVSNRAEAEKKCFAEIDVAMKEIAKEKQLIKTRPELFNSKRDDHYDNFPWAFLHSSKYDKISYIRSYCSPSQNKKHKDIWIMIGYYEYLRTPKGGGKSEVKTTIISFPTSFKEKSRY